MTEAEDVSIELSEDQTRRVVMEVLADAGEHGATAEQVAQAVKSLETLRMQAALWVAWEQGMVQIGASGDPEDDHGITWRAM